MEPAIEGGTRLISALLLFKHGNNLAISSILYCEGGTRLISGSTGLSSFLNIRVLPNSTLLKVALASFRA